MSDSSALSPEQRRQTADVLCAQIRAWLEDPRTTFDLSVRRGLDSRTNAVSGDPELHPNGTATVVLQINGGARHSTGPDVVPVPAVLR